MHFEDARLAVEFAYDALGRRMFKHSSAHYKARREAGSQWNRNEHERKQRELGCGFTLYGWDGDRLAWESSPAQYDGDTGRTVHYLFEPGTFVPVAQAVRHEGIRLIAQPTYSLPYNIDDDPVWTFVPQAKPFSASAFFIIVDRIKCTVESSSVWWMTLSVTMKAKRLMGRVQEPRSQRCKVD